MLTIEKLSLSYEDQIVLKDVDLQVNAKEICTIVGPSGCGKTSLLKAVAGLIDSYEGAISFQNKPLDSKVHTIGYIPQAYGLLPWKTVEKNISSAMKIKGLAINAEGKNKIDEVLKRIGLYDHRKKFPRMLSGGQRQRVAIARAFILQPDVLLMDEPFSALDAMMKEQMQQFFLDMWQERDGSTLFITHDIEEAVYLGDKIGVMMPGAKMKFITSPGKDRDSHEFVATCSQIRKWIREGSNHA